MIWLRTGWVHFHMYMLILRRECTLPKERRRLPSGWSGCRHMCGQRKWKGVGRLTGHTAAGNLQTNK